jgi:N4-gp56 family major capsid protein
MANTNFGLLTSEQKTIWSMDFWKQARNYSFINKFLGKDSQSMIQHIDELKKTEKGARAVITLVADMEGDGVVGDRTLKGNEEILKSYDQVIRIDQMRNANHNEGRMAEQKSIVTFREQSRDKLAYWLADRMDQLAFLSLSGITSGGVGFNKTNKGATRTGSDFPNLEFAADVTVPSAKRNLTWTGGATNTLAVNTGTGGIVGGALSAGDYPRWEMFVQAKAYMKDNYIRGVVSKEGEEVYHAFLTPQAMAKLKLDTNYRDNLRYAQSRGGDNELFTGSSVKVDGIVLHEFRHVYNTAGAASGSKWGSGGLVDGCQILMCGAQALGMADIGNPEWDEMQDDYGNSFGIAVSKILGFKKPVFTTQYSGGTQEDHGLISIYCAQ